jgi:hypothetical protein
MKYIVRSSRPNRSASPTTDVVAGCFPQLYGALGGSPPDQVITM